jgi:hypothetical protein
MTPVAWTLVALLAVVAGCADDSVDPITRITGPRVVAVTTEPSVLALDGELRLTALTVDRDGPRLGVGGVTPRDRRPVDAVRMRACTPWKFITDPARDCVGADALALASDAEGVSVGSAAALAAAFPSPPGIPRGADPWRAVVAAGLDLRVPIIVEVDVDGGTLIARRDLEVAETTAARQNPRIAELRFDGVATSRLREGQRYALTVVFDPASIDESPDPDRAGQPETIECSFYSSTGEFADRQVEVAAADLAETAPTELTAGARGSAWLYIVAADQTGGMTAAWTLLTIE